MSFGSEFHVGPEGTKRLLKCLRITGWFCLAGSAIMFLVYLLQRVL